MSPAKTAEAIKIPFEFRTRVGPMNRALDGVQIPHGRGNFEVERRTIVKYTDTCGHLCKND